MKKLAFLITAWLVHVQILCATDSFDLTEAEAEKIFDRISEEVLLSLKSSLSPPLQRQRRGLETKQSLIDDLGVHRLRSVKPVSKLCYPAIQTLFLNLNNETYSVCVSAATENDPAGLVIGYYQEHTWIPLRTQYLDNPVNAVAFYYEDHIYVLVADSSRKTGTQMLKINLHTLTLEDYHSVTSSYAKRVALWNMKFNGVYNLAIANTNGYDAANLSSVVTVFKWEGTYFDRYSDFPAFDVKDIEPFHIHDTAYIAVANFRRSANNYRVDSEILRFVFDVDDNKWISHQKIRTYGAMDWEFFSLGDGLGQEFFLALANKGDGDKNDRSMIYKFVSDKFVPFQCLQTTKATSIASFSNEGEFILAVANEDDAVYLYQYDGWRFVESGVQMTKGAMSDGVQHLAFHTVMKDSEKVLVLSVSNPRHASSPSVFEIGFARENALKDWQTASTDWCLNTLSKLESTDIDKTIGSLDDFIFIDHLPVTIDGDVVFEEGFVANTLNTPRLTTKETNEVFDNNLLKELEDLQRRLEDIEDKLIKFSDILTNSLKIEGNQTITNSLEFQDVEFECVSHSCHFENIYTTVLNQKPVSDWKNKLVFLDSEQVINGDLWARDINASVIHVQGLIDGVNSHDLVTTSGSHPIRGHKTFNSISAIDVVVSGKVDGVVISNVNILLTTGHQTLHEEIVFEDVLTTTWLNTDFLNGRNLTEFYNDLVLRDKPHIISGHKTLNDVTITELVMTPGSTINGVDIMDLWNNALWIDGRQEINGKITFSDVAFKNLEVSGNINGIQIPGERVVDITETAYITAPQVFENSTKFRDLRVMDSLNGMALLRNPDGSKQLDILLKNGDQTVTGSKTFHTIHLGDHSFVGGTVDGVDLSAFKASVLRNNSTVVTNGTWVFKNVKFLGDLKIEGTVSGVKLEDVYRRALKLNESEIPDMSFHELIHVNALKSNDINGIDVQTDLVLKNKPQTLSGRYYFSEIIIEGNAEVLGFVNDKNFTYLDGVLLKYGSQEIKSKVFNSDVKMGNLIVTGTINGIPMANIVTLKGGKISGLRKLSNVTFSFIDAKNVEVTGKINDINLSEMIANTMTYDGNETVTGEKDIRGTVNILTGANLQTSNLNGYNFKVLLEDAVLLDVPQDISGKTTFLDNVIFSNLSFSGKLDGVSEWEMRYNWMLKDANQTVESDVVFKAGFSANDIHATTVNDMILEDLALDIVKVNEETEISGTVIFENVVSKGDVVLVGKIQDIDLSEEAVSRESIIVTGEKTFEKDLIIKGDLTVDGLVDNVNIEDLCNKTFFKDRKVNIPRLVIKGDVTLLDEATVKGNLAGVNLSLFQDFATDNEPEIKLKGLKTFTSLTLAGPVTLKGKFGGVNLTQLNDNYMSVTRDQEIEPSMAFDDLSFTGVLSVQNLDTATKTVNGIDLQMLNGRILKTHGMQKINATYHIDEVHFESDIYVAGNVSGIELPIGLMRRNHPNYIKGEKIFEQTVIVEGNLDMEDGRTVQDVDVSNWYKESVLNEGKFLIYGEKTFNELDLYDVKVKGTLDGLRISENNLLMTYGDQVVTEAKLIEGDVVIEGSLTVNGLINTVNLTSLSIETLQRDRNNTITGVKRFEKPLTITALEAPAVAGIDVVRLGEKLKTSLNVDHLEKHLEEMEGMISHMQIAFDNQAVLFQYYELFDEFDMFVYDWLYVSAPDIDELLLLSDSSSSSTSCPTIRIFGYDKFERSFRPSPYELPTSYEISARSLTINNLTHLFIPNRNPCCSCTDNISVGTTAIDVYVWNEQNFKIRQSLEVHELFDMVVFKEGDTVCIVVLDVTSSNVFCGSGRIPYFNNTEKLSTLGGQKATVVQSSGRTFLAIAAEYEEGQSYIDIYLWNSAKSEFAVRKQQLQSISIQSIVLINYKTESSEEVYLIFAEKVLPIRNEPKIVVYRFDQYKGIFEKYQDIKDYGILEWIQLKTGELLFFAVDSHQGLIKVYQHKGVSGFVKIDTIKSLGVKKVRPFIRNDPEDSFNHYLALAGNDCSLQSTSHAKILKSKLVGMRPVY